jgi:hypothetical protein
MELAQVRINWPALVLAASNLRFLLENLLSRLDFAYISSPVLFILKSVCC